MFMLYKQSLKVRGSIPNLLENRAILFNSVLLRIHEKTSSTIRLNIVRALFAYFFFRLRKTTLIQLARLLVCKI